MKFDVVIGNPPYQAPKGDKKGKGGDNSLYLKFIELNIELLKECGHMNYVTPPSGIIKSTILKKPTPTLKELSRNGSLKNIDLTAGRYFEVGSFISTWFYTKGEKQGRVKVKHNEIGGAYDAKDLYYLPPKCERLEFDLYNMIINNTEGEVLYITRGDMRLDGTICTFGYPKVQLGGDGRLNFYEKHLDFLKSKLGLWLLDFVRRHDSQTYHRALSGIVIPKEGFKLTTEEEDFIENGPWVNFSKKELSE